MLCSLRGFLFFSRCAQRQVQNKPNSRTLYPTFHRVMTSTAQDSTPEVSDEAFWTQYLENYKKLADIDAHNGCLAVNPKKYHHYSLAVTTLRGYFEQLRLPVPKFNEICAVLKLPFVDGDVVKAFHMARYYQLAEAGFFLTNSSVDKAGGVITYRGSENWENVMCYLDALLFAMFANIEAFEPILFVTNQHSNPKVNQLSGLLRVYASLLRLGNLITTDLTMQLCEVLTALGFEEALSHRQQDLAALFVFLTEILAMPLLTFKIDIKHGGKFSKEDDQKISKERLLFVLIPEDDEEEATTTNTSLITTKTDSGGIDGSPTRISTGSSTNLDQAKPLLLNNPFRSDGLTPYAGAVKVPATPASPSVMLPSDKPVPDTLAAPTEASTNILTAPNAVTPPDSDEEPEEILLEECLEHYFNNLISVKRELERRATQDHGMIEVIEGVPLETTTAMNRSSLVLSTSKEPLRDSLIRTRSLTLLIWLEAPPQTGDKPINRRRATSIHEVSLPAWMFLRLLPFYTDDNDVDGTAKNLKEFVNRRPILPICLKRYNFDAESARANRLNKRVVIPPVISLPQFVADEDDHQVNLFKLILELAVCHRGTLILLGHFIAVTRKNNNITDLSLDDGYNDPWVLFNDMNKKLRIQEKTFKEIFDVEWPYLLFYRLVSDDDHEPRPATVPVVRPQGFKGKYWNERLLPILSATHLPLQVPVDRRGSVASGASIPIPDIPPTDPRFVDIRNRYYWYVTDHDHNYYKELPTKGSEGGGSEVTMSPQFRRNSQWSGEKLVHTSVIPDINELMGSGRSAGKLVDDAAIAPRASSERRSNTKEVKVDEKRKLLGRLKLKKEKKRRERYRDEKCIVM